ncbi:MULTISPECIES: SGNH/GDSL hydrolase family protein [unclassified Sphingobium]|uniref:SGNH/GDSL hydrolase family protein n=1 Tax=unclassified Sphingobium TaxID=2611147 RepID=UPI002225B073|nr:MULTISPECIES: SGNH/GDSL hydrolase family protein [unclassified Sphingobium]MCW2410317.1 lysophospholipase L1-like esterase [Sphingobium sp. B8D3D]MCW2413991.1 lysophospholipase L1-like esterase [Sphingobium sp. B8D3A]
MRINQIAHHRRDHAGKSRIGRTTGIAAIALGLLLSAAPARADWITSWSAAPVRPRTDLGPLMAPRSYNNQTLMQTLRIAAGGKALRLRLTNAYGEKPLEIGGVRIALLDPQGAEVPGSARMLRFGGAATARIPARAPLLSDTVDMPVPDLARLSVQIYVPGDTGPCTCHESGLDTLRVSPPGNYLGKPFEPVQQGPHRPFLAAVEVDAQDGAGTIAMLADSITDGIGSTPGANRRWPDFLAARLSAAAPGKWGIANQGISGNRVLSDGFGDSALARLDRDILALPGIRYLIVFEGVNDLGIAFGAERMAQQTGRPNVLADGTKVTLETMLAGYRQIAERARARGITAVGATIAPYKGATYWTPEAETVRQGINAAIRSGTIFDAWVDFDAAFADPPNPQQMRPGYHMGDFLHGTDAGYEALAASIDLSLFK